MDREASWSKEATWSREEDDAQADDCLLHAAIGSSSRSAWKQVGRGRANRATVRRWRGYTRKYSAVCLNCCIWSSIMLGVWMFILLPLIDPSTAATPERNDWVAHCADLRKKYPFS